MDLKSSKRVVVVGVSPATLAGPISPDTLEPDLP